MPNKSNQYSKAQKKPKLKVKDSAKKLKIPVKKK